MLYTNPEIDWFSFSEEGFSGGSQDEDSVSSTLKLSYDRFPPCLKHCFAFCSLFPKNYEMTEEVVTDHWIANGFITISGPNQCLEDIAHRYFQDLVSRSSFQIAGDDGSYKMHDLVHDLALLVAGKKCATITEGNYNVDQRTRHVSLDFDSCSTSTWDIDPSLLLGAKKIRSILMPTQSNCYVGYRSLDRSFCNAIVSKFRFLRSLDLQNSGVEKIPSSIGRLKHLRCLDVSSNVMLKTLPDSVSKLQNLRSLNINNCSSFEELPRATSKLVNLRNLRLKQCRNLTHMPRGIGQLTKLRTLSNFVLSKETNSVTEVDGKLNELSSLHNLRGELEISNLRHGMESKHWNFAENRHLRSLKLVWDSDDDSTKAVDDEMTIEGIQSVPNLQKMWIEGYGGVGFPNCLSSTFSNVIEMTLINCGNCRCLPPLDLLRSLKKLELNCMPALRYVVKDYDLLTSLMRSLKIVALKDLPNLKGWWKDIVNWENSSLSNENTARQTTYHNLFFHGLDELIITNCPELCSMPLYQSINDWLVLKNINWKPFEQTMTSVLSSAPLSKLTNLVIKSNKNLQCLPEWLKGLTSLKLLRICGCPKLKSLSPGIRHFGSLPELEISECEELDIFDNETWHALRSLRILRLRGLPQLLGLPEGLRQVATLQHLYIGLCYNLRTLPEWISGIGILKKICIWECPGFLSLPQGMLITTSLLKIDVVGNPVLRQRFLITLDEDSWSKYCLFTVLILRPQSGAMDSHSSGSYSGIIWMEDEHGCFKPQLLKN